MDKLKIDGKDYPFYDTAKGRLNVEKAKVDLKKVGGNRQEALRFAHQVAAGAADYEGKEFKFDFNTFANKVEVAVFEKAEALAESLMPKPIEPKEAKEVKAEDKAEAKDQAKK